MNFKKVFTTAEAAEILKCSTRKVRYLLHDKKLKGEKLGGEWRIPEKEIERYTGK